MMKLKELLTTGVAIAIAFGLTTGFVYGQGEPENSDDAPPPVGQEQPDEKSSDEGNVPTEPGQAEGDEGNVQTDRDVHNGTRDSLADQLVRDHPDRDEIQKHLEEALIASGVSSDEATKKSEELARKITDALAESNTEADEFDGEGEFDENRGTEKDTEEDKEDDNGGLW